MTKQVISLLSVVIVILLTACSNSADKEEIERLKSENESLRANTESTLDITEIVATNVSETILETTVETTTTVPTTTTEATTTTIKEMTADEVQSIIAIAGAKVSKINSADGVNVDVFWRNNSDKDIKYLTFTLEIYNAVNDVIADNISGKKSFICKLTGPIQPFQYTLDNLRDEWLGTCYNMSTAVYDDTLGLCYSGPNIDPATGVRERFAIPRDEYYKITTHTEWDTIMYNKTANSVKITGIQIDYMDGTSITLSQNEIGMAYLE